MATQLRKKAQAEEDREELDMPELAFACPTRGRGKIRWKKKQAGISHVSDPALPMLLTLLPPESGMGMYPDYGDHTKSSAMERWP